MTNKDLAKLIKVNPNTITNWTKSKPELIRLIHLGLNADTQNIDFNIEQSKGIKMQKYILVEDTNKKSFLNEVAEKLTEGFEVAGGVALTKTKGDQILYAQAMIQKIHIQTRPY